MTERGARTDPWQALTGQTPARVALGRAGGSLPTAELLRFALDHAEARDAVHTPLDAASIVQDLEKFGRPVVTVASQAVDHSAYLGFPDRGRRLRDADRSVLEQHEGDAADVVLIVGDGLSATAVHRHGVTLVGELLLRFAGRSIAPIVVATHARVALQDDIGHALRARSAIILLGERPGLGAADSLGAYLVFDPKPGRTDAQRNCVSNIRPNGLALASAADTLTYLLDAALHRGLSGVPLKDDRPAAPLGGPPPVARLP